MNISTKKAIASLALVAGIGATPIVPETMTFDVAYEHVYFSPYQITQFTATGTVSRIVKDDFPFPDTNKDGKEFIAVFKDSSGNSVSVPISESLYRSMGMKDGAKYNPTRTEYLNIFQALTPKKAQAAIAFDTSSTGTACSGASSCTKAYTAGSGNPLFTMGIIGSATTDNLTGCTANGSAMTEVAGAGFFAGRYMYLFFIVGKSGTFNSVCSNNSTGDLYIQMDMSSYTGASQTGQPDANTSGTSVASSLSLSVTTVANNSWVVGMFESTGGSITSVTNGTQRASLAAGYGVYDSNGPKTPAGSYTMTANNDISTTMAGIMASFSPAAGGGGGTTAAEEFMQFR